MLPSRLCGGRFLEVSSRGRLGVGRGLILSLLVLVAAPALGQANVTFRGPDPWVDLTAYGALGDGKINTSARMALNGTSTLTLQSVAVQWGFAASDIGKYIALAPGGAGSPLAVPTLGAATLVTGGYLGTGTKPMGGVQNQLICVQVEAIQDNADLPVAGAVNARSTPSSEVCTQANGSSSTGTGLQFAAPGNLGTSTGYRVLAAPEGQLTSVTVSGAGSSCTNGTYVMQISGAYLKSTTDLGQGAIVQFTVSGMVLSTTALVLAPGFGFTDASISPAPGTRFPFPFCTTQPTTMPTFNFAGNSHERLQIQQSALQDFVQCGTQSATNLADNACNTGSGFTLYRYTSTGGLATTSGVFLSKITGFNSATSINVVDAIPVGTGANNGNAAWGTDNSGVINTAITAISNSIANTALQAPRGIKLCVPTVGATNAVTGRYFAIGGFRLPFNSSIGTAATLGYDLTTCGGGERGDRPTEDSSNASYGGGAGAATLGSLGSDWAVNVGFWATPTATITGVTTNAETGVPPTTATFIAGSPPTFPNQCAQGAQLSVLGCLIGGYNQLHPTLQITSVWSSGTTMITATTTANGLLGTTGCTLICGVPTGGGAVRGVSIHDISVEDPLLTSSYGGVLLQGNWSGANLLSDTLRVYEVDANNFDNGFCFAGAGIQIADFYRNGGSCLGAYYFMDDVSDATVEGGRFAWTGIPSAPTGYGYGIWAYNNPISPDGAAPGNNRFLDIRAIDFPWGFARSSTQQSFSLGNFSKQENIGLTNGGGAAVGCAPGTACYGTSFIEDDPTLGLANGCRNGIISDVNVGRVADLYQIGTGCSNMNISKINAQQIASQTQSTAGNCVGMDCQFLGADFGTNTDNCIGNQAIGIQPNCIYNGGFTKDAGTIQCIGADCTGTTSTANIFAGMTNPALSVPPANSSFHCTILYQQLTTVAMNTLEIQSAIVPPVNLHATYSAVTSIGGALAQGDSGNIINNTATAFSTKFMPAAVATPYKMDIDGTIETNAPGSMLTFLWSVGLGGGSLNALRGSYCRIVGIQ